MGRKPREDEIDRLEKENRELKALNRQLTKRLRKVDRYFRKTLEIEEEEARKAPKTQKKVPDCSQCKDGFLQEITFMGKSFKKCNKCAFRTETIKNG